MSNNVVELCAVRHDQLQKLFDAHHSALTELICAYAHMDDPDYAASLQRFLSAERSFVAAYHALNKATGEES